MSAKRYVVGYDGTKPGRAALRMAAVMARAFGAELDVVLVLREDNPYQHAYPPVGDLSAVLEAQARTWLQEAVQVVEKMGDDASGPRVAVRTHLWRSRSVAAGLLEAIERLDPVLVAVSSGSGKGRLSVGPVADALLHTSPVPVALAPRNYKPQTVPHHIYAAVGTRPGAQQVVAQALGVARRTGLPLEVISFLTDDDGGARDAAACQAVLEQVRRIVTEVAGAEGEGTPIHVASGANLKKAVATVEWQPGGVLLIGSSRLAQGRQLFLGTTAARLLRHLPVPMVVVPRPAQATTDPATGTGSSGE